MLEVQNINAIEKGSLLATCDIHIIPWKMTLHEVKIFQKGANRWIGMPSKEFTNDKGEKKYTDLVTFDNEGIKNRFRSQIMGAIDKYLSENPDMKGEDVIKEDDEIPF
jgi:DNA-binding cell septation regulator SpoVG